MSDEILSRIAGWCDAENDLEIEGQTITVGGDLPLEISVDLSDEAVTLTHLHTPGDTPEGFSEHAAALLGNRGTMTDGEVLTADAGTTVALRYPVYLDGLNRQTFLLAVREIAGTVDSLTEIGGAAAGVEAVTDEAPVTDAEPEAPATEPEVEAVEDTTETVVIDPTPHTAPWAPTHTVPAGGISAWTEPDPALAPVATLAERVELRIDEQRGAWARVTGSNGWTGWVDARKLRALPAAAATSAGMPATAAVAAAGTAGGGVLGGMLIKPLALVGGLMMVIGAVLKWVTAPFEVNGWDVGAGWLWRGSLAQPRLGLVLTVLGIAAIGLAFMPKIQQAALAAVGLIAVIVTALFAYQVVDVLASGQWEVLWDGGIGIGWWIAFLGSVLVAIPVKLRL